MPTVVRPRSIEAQETSKKNHREMCVKLIMFLALAIVICAETAQEVRIYPVYYTEGTCRPNFKSKIGCHVCTCAPDGRGHSCEARECYAEIYNQDGSVNPKKCPPGEWFTVDGGKCLCPTTNESGRHPLCILDNKDIKTN